MQRYLYVSNQDRYNDKNSGKTLEKHVLYHIQFELIVIPGVGQGSLKSVVNNLPNIRKKIINILKRFITRF